MSTWPMSVVSLLLVSVFAAPALAAPPAAPTATTLTSGALTVHPRGGVGDSVNAFNAAGAGPVRVTTLPNIVDAMLTMDCFQSSGFASGTYLLPCRPGDTAIMSYGGAMNDLDLTVTDANGVTTHWPEQTLFTLVIAADNVALPDSIDAAPFVARGPFTLTLITPNGQLYTGAGTFAATFVADADDPTRWNGSQVVYTLLPPAQATPHPGRPHRH